MAKDFNISLLLDFYGDMLTEKQRQVIEYYYNDDLSLSEISENVGITRQGVRDSIKRAEGQLLGMEERLGLVCRFREFAAGLEQIEETAEKIKEYNDHYTYSKEIREGTLKILEITKKLCE